MRKSPSKSLYSLSITPKVIPFYSTSPCGSCWPNICSCQKPKKSSWISPSPSPSPLTSDNQATSPTATYRIQSKCTPSLSLSHCSHHPCLLDCCSDFYYSSWLQRADRMNLKKNPYLTQVNTHKAIIGCLSRNIGNECEMINSQCWKKEKRLPIQGTFSGKVFFQKWKGDKHFPRQKLRGFIW